MTILRVLLLFVFIFVQVRGQCTFRAPFASSTWLDNARGTLVFTDTQVSGWEVNVINQQVNTWNCYSNASSSRIVLKSAHTILYSTVNIDIYACLVLTKITDVSYTYVLQQIPVPDAGYERLLFSNEASVPESTICDTSASVPALEFYVLVQQGMGASAAITFPNMLLRNVDYEYQEDTGTVACNGTQESLNMCSDQTQLSVNYSYCPQQIAYTAGGQAWCVAKKSLSGYDCAVVMNQDVTITGTATQFACICSNGNKMSVVANNCTSNQNPTSYPTAADGVSVIGYQLVVKTVLENCAPVSESESASSNVGLIVGIVIVLLIIIAVVIISFILYKRGNCVVICGHVKGCLKKTPCWEPCKNKLCVCCSKNKVAELEKPILTNGNAPHVETINETSSSLSRPKLMKDKTSMSAITRSSTMVANREKSELDKSMITRQATATSIGLDMKSERSVSVRKVNVKVADETQTEDTTKDGGSKKEAGLSILNCFRGKDAAKDEEVEPTDKEEVPDTKPDKKKPKVSKEKKGSKAAKKGGGKKAKGETKGKKGKQNKEKSEKTTDKDVEKENTSTALTLSEVTTSEAPQGKKNQKPEMKKDTPRQDDQDTSDEQKETPRVEKGKKSDKKKKETPRDEKGKTSDETHETPRNEKGKKSDEPIESPRDQGKKTKAKKGTPRDEKETKPDLIRAPTKMNTDLHLTSTPVPGSEKGKKGVVSVPTALVKPEDKRTEWTFLSCCFGNRSPPPQDDFPPDANDVPITAPTAKKKAPTKAGKGGKSNKKGDGGGGKAGGKKVNKNAGKKSDVNGNGIIVEDLTDEAPVVERSKTMPEKQREKTSLSMKDAEKVKVDVYIPDDKTNLQLKDTIIVKEKNGELQLLKAKSDVGLARPASSKSRASVKSAAKKDKNSGDKSKGGSKTGSKDKKKKKKK